MKVPPLPMIYLGGFMVSVGALLGGTLYGVAAFCAFGLLVELVGD